MLQQPNRLCFHELIHHVAQHSADGIKPFIRMADVRQARLVEEDLLNNEDGNRFGQLRTCFHDTKTKWNDFSREEEVDYCVVVILLKGRGVNMMGQLLLRMHTFTRAPITPREVRRRYSKGRVLDVVLRNGYKNKGM